MPDADATIKGSVKIRKVREIGGWQIFEAVRLSAGPWFLVETKGAFWRTVKPEEFLKTYERIPDLDR